MESQVVFLGIQIPVKGMGAESGRKNAVGRGDGESLSFKDYLARNRDKSLRETHGKRWDDGSRETEKGLRLTEAQNRSQAREAVTCKGTAQNCRDAPVGAALPEEVSSFREEVKGLKPGFDTEMAQEILNLLSSLTGLGLEELQGLLRQMGIDPERLLQDVGDESGLAFPENLTASQKEFLLQALLTRAEDMKDGERLYGGSWTRGEAPAEGAVLAQEVIPESPKPVLTLVDYRTQKPAPESEDQGAGITQKKAVEAALFQNTKAAVSENSKPVLSGNAKPEVPENPNPTVAAIDQGLVKAEADLTSKSAEQPPADPGQGFEGILLVAKDSDMDGVGTSREEGGRENSPYGFGRIPDASLWNLNLRPFETSRGQAFEGIRNYSPEQLWEQVISPAIEKARVILTDEKSEIVIDLKPESLGRLSLKIVTENGAVAARFTADSYQVKEVLEANMQALRDSLERQGLNVQGFSVSVRQEQERVFKGRDTYLTAEKRNSHADPVAAREAPVGYALAGAVSLAGYGLYGNRIDLMA